VEEGKQALDDAAGAVPPYDVRAMLVLTDGNENTPPMIASAASDLTANTFAIGFGLAGNVSAAALNALTLGTGGYLLVTGALGPSDTFRLTKYFLQIQAGISNADVVLDPQGLLAVGTKHRISFPVTEADHGLEVILLSAAPQLIDYALETPDGQVIDPARAGAEPSVAFVSAAKTSYYRMGLPALAGRRLGSHAGQWHAVLSLGRRTKAEGLAAAEVRKGALPYALLVHCYSTLRMKALLQQSRFVPPADLLITARLTEYDAPVEHRATVWAEVTWPNDSSATVRLREAEPGNYRGDVRAEMPGVYRVRVRATGATFAGRPFQRESTLTAALFLGSSGSGTSNGGGLSDLDDQHARLCKLLSCVLEKAAAGDKVRALLADWGIDRERLQACLKEYCEPRGARVMAETRRKPLSEEGKAPKEKITFLEEPKAEPRRRTEFTKQMHRHPFPLLSELAGKQPGVSTHEHDPAKGPAEHAQGKSAKEGRSKKRGKRRSS
jgi:hypothetical protein